MALNQKTCCKCKTTKPISSFCANKAKKDGLNVRCRSCAKEQTKLSRVLHPERVKEHGRKYQRNNKDKVRSFKLKYRYGITTNDYNSLHKNQEGNCAICNKHESNFTKILFVDHCHVTLKVRGLLCVNCNSILGLANDNIEILKNSIKYLSK